MLEWRNGGKSGDFWCSNFKFPCNVDQEIVKKSVWFNDIGPRSENDLVNQHYAYDRNNVLAFVANGQNNGMEKIETISRNCTEDEQIQLLKNILETNPNL